jgi:hypothetical protein
MAGAGVMGMRDPQSEAIISTGPRIPALNNNPVFRRRRNNGDCEARSDVQLVCKAYKNSAIAGKPG